jgi:hypothetical protein
VGFLCFGLDGVEVVLVVKGQHAAEAVAAEVLDKGAGDHVAVFEQPLFELVGVLEGPPVGQLAGGIDDGMIGIRFCPVSAARARGIVAGRAKNET